MNYELKDKITVNKDFLGELEAKGWQEIEYLQAQINNLAEGATNDKLRQLFKNLLTSYYVFTGGIETLASEPINNTSIQQELQLEELAADTTAEVTELAEIEVPNPIEDLVIKNEEDSYEVSEPFEYFVDFDEPIGEPISDEDLYGN